MITVGDATVNEARPLRLVGTRPEFGRSQEVVECPFCLTHVATYIWSRCGSGKRCECGALLCRNSAFKKIGEIKS